MEVSECKKDHNWLPGAAVGMGGGEGGRVGAREGAALSVQCGGMRLYIDELIYKQWPRTCRERRESRRRDLSTRLSRILTDRRETRSDFPLHMACEQSGNNSSMRPVYSSLTETSVSKHTPS